MLMWNLIASLSGLSAAQLVSFLPFPCCSLWKEVTLCSPHLSSSLFRVKQLHNLFGILLHGRFISSLSFINLFNYLYWYGLRIFKIVQVIIQYTLFIFVQIVPALDAEISFSWLLFLFNLTPSLCVFEHFLTLCHYKIFQAQLVCFLP